MITEKTSTESSTTLVQVPQETTATLLAGFAERDFTPTEGGQIPGCTIEVCEGVDVPLYANAAAFECGDSSLILISMDILKISLLLTLKRRGLVVLSLIPM